MKSLLTCLLISFTSILHCQLEGDESFDMTNEQLQNPSNSKDSIYLLDNVSKSPIFMTDTLSLKEFIGANIHYPKNEFEEDFETKVYVEFIILKDGTVDYFHILKRNLDCPECDREAVRVLKLTNNKWEPAKIKDEFVNCKMVIPIVFKMN